MEKLGRSDLHRLLGIKWVDYSAALDWVKKNIVGQGQRSAYLLGMSEPVKMSGYTGEILVAAERGDGFDWRHTSSPLIDPEFGNTKAMPVVVETILHGYKPKSLVNGVYMRLFK